MIEHLTHLSNCHGEWNTMLMGVPFLGAALLFLRVKGHALRVWFLTTVLRRKTHCTDGHAHPCSDHKVRGFTLIELMITIAALGIGLTVIIALASFAIPFLRTCLDRLF